MSTGGYILGVFGIKGRGKGLEGIKGIEGRMKSSRFKDLNP